MSKSEAVVIESIEVRELLRFLFYLDILNKLSLLLRKHSKYMYAKCLNFPCFITYLAACMHAFCMFYLYVSLGKAQAAEGKKIFRLVFSKHKSRATRGLFSGIILEHAQEVVTSSMKFQWLELKSTVFSDFRKSRIFFNIFLQSLFPRNSRLYWDLLAKANSKSWTFWPDKPDFQDTL